MENLRQWTFSAAAGAGNASPSRLTIPYVAELQGREEYYTPPSKVVLDLPDRVTITTNPPEPQL